MNNKIRVTVFTAIVGVFLIILVSIVINVIDKANTNKYNYAIKNIISVVKTCHINGTCNDEKVTLKFLYDNKLIEEQKNPKTNQDFNEESYVDTRSYEFIIVP